MEKKKNLQLLAEAPVWKALIKLGIPTMIGMMVSSLYNLVDTYFVGSLGTSAQAAVSAVFPVSLVMLGIGLLFGCGAGSYVARLLGKGDKKKADECVSTAVGLAVITALILVVIMLIVINPLLRILGCTESMLPYAREYAIPFILGLVINVFNSTMSNLATAEGQPMYSMRSMLLGGLVNIILDPLFIIVFHMGVFGAAIATLVARLVSFSTYMAYLLQKRSSLHFSVRLIHPNKELLIEIAKIGVPTLFYQVLCSLALSISNNVANPYGDSVIAAIGIVNRLITLGIMTVMGFLKGYQTFVGFNYGAKKYERVREATRLSVIWTTIFCTICSVILIVFHNSIIQAFNKTDAEVLRIGLRTLYPCVITFLTVGFQVVYSTKFMGLGKGLEGGLISLGRQGFFFIPAIYIMSGLWGLSGLIYAQPVADLLSMMLVVGLAYKNHIQENELIRDERSTLR